MPDDDHALLSHYSEHRSDEAFSALVQRHLHLVYFAALRQTNGDAHRAEDATQETFTRLAGKAAQLVDHPQLAGWLHTTACHCARTLARSERRRTIREGASVAETMTAPGVDDHLWLQVRPVIDEALEELPAEDREAVLLRFFENRPFAEIAERLKLSENAARMRVSRTLDCLERALAKRGIPSTAAALAGALTIPAALAVPASLSSQIFTSALSAVALAGGGATIFSILKLMTSTKVVGSIAALAIVIAAGTAIHQHHLLGAAQADRAVLRQHESDLTATVETLNARLQAEKKRAEEADHDNEKLLAAAADLQRIRSLPTEAETAIPVTQRSVNARYQHGKDLARNGQPAEALKEFLWCYDTGMPQVASFGGVRGSFLLSSISELGKYYPPALQALRERRDKIEVRMQQDGADNSALMDFGSLNNALGDNDKNLEFFDSMAAFDRRRAYVLYYVTDHLLEARRYSDITSTSPYSKMATNFEMVSKTAEKPKMASLRSFLVESTSKNIEALAGAGDLPHAEELATKLLTFNNTPETRAAINQHLTRAGHPELLRP